MTKPDLFEVLVHYGWHPPMPGAGWRAMQCNVHGDRNASASINYDLEKINCHACGFRGDVYDVIQYEEGVDFAAARRIGERFSDSINGEVQPEPYGLAGRSVPGWARRSSSDSPFVPAWIRS